MHITFSLSLSIYIYIYIYMYKEREERSICADRPEWVLRMGFPMGLPSDPRAQGVQPY